MSNGIGDWLEKCSGGSKLDKCGDGKQPDPFETRKGVITTPMAMSLDKAGEGPGSKGGKVIGHTKSGKPIYDSADHAGHAGFTRQEHMEAFNAHQEAKIGGDAGKVSHHAEQSRAHQEMSQRAGKGWGNMSKMSKSDEEAIAELGRMYANAETDPVIEMPEERAPARGYSMHETIGAAQAEHDQNMHKAQQVRELLDQVRVETGPVERPTLAQWPDQLPMDQQATLLIKGDDSGYRLDGGVVGMVQPNRVVQSVLCKSCGTERSAYLTACPECGEGRCGGHVQGMEELLGKITRE